MHKSQAYISTQCSVVLVPKCDVHKHSANFFTREYLKAAGSLIIPVDDIDAACNVESIQWKHFITFFFSSMDDCNYSNNNRHLCI